MPNEMTMLGPPGGTVVDLLDSLDSLRPATGLGADSPFVTMPWREDPATGDWSYFAPAGDDYDISDPHQRSLRATYLRELRSSPGGVWQRVA